MKKLLVAGVSLIALQAAVAAPNMTPQWGWDSTQTLPTGQPLQYKIGTTWTAIPLLAQNNTWTGINTFSGGIQSSTTFPLSITFTGSGTPAKAWLNQSGIASSSTLPEIGGQFTMTSNVGNANKGSAYKIALTSSVVSGANSADIYGINTIAAGYNTHLITGVESDVNVNGGSPGALGSSTGAYSFVATTGGLSPITAGYWAVALNAGSMNDAFASTGNIVRANYYAGAPAQYGLLLSGTQTAAQILGVGFNITSTGALNTISANVSTAAAGYYLNNQHTLFDDGTFVVLTNHNAAAQAITLANLYSFYSADNHIFRNTATSTPYLTLSPSSATFNSPIQAGVASSTTGSLAFANASSAFLTTLQAGNASAAVTYTLPTAAPAGANYALISGTTGTMSWASPATIVTLTPGTTPTSGGAAGQLMYDTGSVLQESANLVFASNTLTVGKATSATGALALGGATSGTATITAQATAGTPTLTLPNTSGTLVSNASAPLSISSTTGAISITGAAGQILAGATPAFTATPTLGVNATTTGTLGLANGGATGATVTVQNNGATTAYNFNLPTTVGTAGYLLTSQAGGSSAMTWTSPTTTVNGQSCTLGSSCTVTAAASSIPFPATVSGTVTSGGIPYFSSTTAMASSALLAQYQLVVGGGAGAAPATLGATGSAGQHLQSGGAAANPSWTTATFPATTTAGTILASGTTNTVTATATPTLGVQSTTAGTLTLANTNAGAFPTTLASSASSTAAWTLTLPVATPAANGAVLTATTGGVSSWTTSLPVANGGTACTAASITCFNNITGFTAAGTTGTTSTNLVFSTSPTLVTPVLGVATGTSLALNGATLGTNALSVAGTTNMTDSLTIATSTQYHGFSLTNAGGAQIVTFNGLSASNDGGTLSIFNAGISNIRLSAFTGLANYINNGGVLCIGATSCTYTLDVTGIARSTGFISTAATANTLTAGANGTTNPAFNVDASTASSATGINIKSAAAAGGVALSAISSGTNENLTIDAKGSGTITLGGTSTGATIIPKVTLYGPDGSTYNLTVEDNTSLNRTSLAAAGNIGIKGGVGANIWMQNPIILNASAPSLIISTTTPTIASGFGTSPSLTVNSGTAAFQINVGTGGTASSGTITMPASSNGWSCSAADITTQSTTVFYTKQTASTTTSVTLTNYNTAGAAAAWVASDKLNVMCMGY